VLIAGTLGVLLEERHETGGIDAAVATEQLRSHAGPMAGRIDAMTVADGLVVRTELDPGRQPFLDDHRIDGTAVLPGVMGIEAFAEAATALLPRWRIAAVEDVDLRAPFKFYRDEPRALEVRAQLRDTGDGDVVADCRLIGRRALHGRAEEETVHFTGRVRLTRAAPHTPPLHRAPDGEHATAVAGDAVYRVYFHGPAFRVLDEAYRANGDVVGRLAGELPAVQDPPDRPTDADVVDADGRVRLRLEGYRTTPLPDAPDDEALAPIRSAMRVSG
jgi:hypothetical protein